MLYNYRCYSIDITPDFMVAGSALPEKRDLQCIKRLGHTTIISLLEKEGWLQEPVFELSNNIARMNLNSTSIAHYHLEVNDFEAPSIDVIYKFIKIMMECVKNKSFPLVHCRGGNGRTGTLLAAFYVWNSYRKNRFFSMDKTEELSFFGEKLMVDPLTSEAISYIREKAPHSVETTTQAQVLTDFVQLLDTYGSATLDDITLSDTDVLIAPE